MKESVRTFLIQNSEAAYKEFSQKLIPGEDCILGVRLPILRKKAKALAKGNWKEELAAEDIYYEETMLRGMTISYVKGSLEELLLYIEEFIPKVTNWSVCDSVFAGMEVLRTDKEKTWQFIQPYLYSEKEFEVRVAIVIMMNHLLKSDSTGANIKRMRTVTMADCLNQSRPDAAESQMAESANPYLPRILSALDRAFPQYYASMAAAWTLAEAFCCYPAEVYLFLKDTRLDTITYNRTIQKIAESLIPEADVKSEIRKMKRK
jgi:hypothetical protein